MCYPLPAPQESEIGPNLPPIVMVEEVTDALSPFIYLVFALMPYLSLSPCLPILQVCSVTGNLQSLVMQSVLLKVCFAQISKHSMWVVPCEILE